MEKRDPAITRAERLRAIVSMPEYGATVGAWIREEHEAALHQMETAKEPADFHAAQGAYRAIKSLMQQFEKVFQTEAAAISKMQKKQAKGTTT